MIATLRGKLIEVLPPCIILDVGGVGYEISMPLSHIARVNKLDNELLVYTHLSIREDAHSLFGFLEQSERDCFRQLIKVSGVGPKIGLALLSNMVSNEIQFAIDNSDIVTLSRTPGIGKKMAERIILELKNKLTQSSDNQLIESGFLQGSSIGYSIKQDIYNALESLGYSAKEIGAVIKQIGNVTDLSEGIKQSLRLLNKF